MNRSDEKEFFVLVFTWASHVISCRSWSDREPNAFSIGLFCQGKRKPRLSDERIPIQQKEWRIAHNENKDKLDRARPPARYSRTRRKAKTGDPVFAKVCSMRISIAYQTRIWSCKNDGSKNKKVLSPLPRRIELANELKSWPCSVDIESTPMHVVAYWRFSKASRFDRSC